MQAGSRVRVNIPGGETMTQTINQLLSIDEVAALIQKIRENANEIWYLDDGELITVRRGNRIMQVAVRYSEGQALTDKHKALEVRR